MAIMFNPGRSVSEGAALTPELLGLNFVADWERIGTRNWETFDEIVNHFEPGVIRYPGGITAESHFDIFNPNASSLYLPDGTTRPIMGAYDFAEFCSSTGAAASFIIPTRIVFENLNASGELLDGTGLEAAIYELVLNVLRAGGEGVDAIFEIGNEYESYMSNQDYARVVNLIAPIVNAAIGTYAEEQSDPSIVDDIKIAVQAWTFVAQTVSSVSMDDLTHRGEVFLSMLSDNAANSIDLVTTHWYLSDRDTGASVSDIYSQIESSIESSMSVVSSWSSLLGNDIGLFVSEWNLMHNTDQAFGLAQVGLVMRSLVELMNNGVDIASFWSAQYHATSLALPNGQLTATGAALNYLMDSAIGMSASSVVTQNNSIGSVLFEDEQNAIMVVSNLNPNPVGLNFDFSEVFSGLLVSSVGVLSVDVSGADGSFRDYNNLQWYEEPDLPGAMSWTLASEIGSAQPFEVTLGSFESAFVEGLVLDDLEIASREYNVIPAEILIDGILAGSLPDIISFAGFESAIDFSLLGAASVSEFLEALPVSAIEGVIGTDFDDTLGTRSWDNVVLAGNGDDRVFFSGEMATEVDVGHEIGGSLEFGGGLIDGGPGIDSLNLTGGEMNVFLYPENAQIETADGHVVRVANVEELFGSEETDTFQIYGGTYFVDASDGEDTILIMDGHVSANLGDGSDFLLSYGGECTVNAGTGDDWIQFLAGGTASPGPGNDILYASNSGVDTFIFEVGEGDDIVHGFSTTQDVLLFSEVAAAAIRSGEYAVDMSSSGPIVTFEAGGSISLIGVSIGALDDLLNAI